MRSNTARQAVVDFVVGGTPHLWLTASPADVVVGVDSLNELQGVLDRPTLLKVPLGENETVLTLLDRNRQRTGEASLLYEEYSKRYGTTQSLQTLHDRHGFSRIELVTLLRREDF